MGIYKLLDIISLALILLVPLIYWVILFFARKAGWICTQKKDWRDTENFVRRTRRRSGG